ncbi:Golgi-body localization protein domain isoform 1 [Rhynchospora pubera]|uniref:Golgi-body localization protein domain isoform 1 n=1 Tax=Rhynchospora pubera TaxID=906938 RepID=A0AAV8FSD0_9POAL|nr:Golgi-body localization protein domain isoform 1 [Rhynchospora pubera]
MGVLLVRVLFFSMVSCSLGWVLLVIATQLMILVMRHLLGISIKFRIAQINCIKDVSIQFKKGVMESISIGEIKLILKESLLDLGLTLSSRNSIFELVLSDFTIAMRSKLTTQSAKKKKSKPPNKKKPGSGGGKEKKLMMLAKAARFLSLSVINITFKTPKAAIGVKELKVDLTTCEGLHKSYKFRLHMMPILVYMFPTDAFLGQPINFSNVEEMANGQTCSNSVTCEDFLVTCELEKYRDEGVKIRELDVKFGAIIVNSNESLLANKKPVATVGPSSCVDAPSNTIKSGKKSSGLESKVSSLRKQIVHLPEKVSLNMPKLDVRFTHQVHCLSVYNSITGISLRATKSPSTDESRNSSSQLGLQLDFSEIHLLRDGSSSILEILRVAASASFNIPNEEIAPIRAEVDVKFGGTQCNLMISRLAPLLSLSPAKKPKPIVSHEESSSSDLSTHRENLKDMEQKAQPIIWNATGSAPEITIILFSTDDLSLFHVCSQSFHISANNFAKSGSQLHGELGELNIAMSYSHHHNSKEHLHDIEADPSSLLHISKMALETGKEEPKSDESVTSLNISGIDANLSFQPLEAILVMVASIKALLKKVSSPGKRSVKNRSTHGSSQISTGTKRAKKIMKISLDRCMIKYFGEMVLEDMNLTDPKRVNYGFQGGKVLVTTCPDGTPRTASIFATGPSNCKKINFCTSFEILHLGVCMNKEKRSTQIELERAQSVFKEFLDGENPGNDMTLFDMQKAKLVRRSGGLSDGSSCSLFTVTDISVRWEPDLHLSLFEEATKLKAVMHKVKTQNPDPEPKEEPVKIEPLNEKEAIKKKESIFAVDIEKFNITAEVADGVEAAIHVQSIFSENTKIGILFEGLELRFNGARIFNTSRTQVSRIPVSMSSHHMPDGKLHHVTVCDWVIQAGEMHVCMPYRLELRAIDDAVEDTIRCLKLISTAKTNLLFPEKSSIVKKAKPKTRSTKIRFVRFIVHELVGEIEEEPLQGWLDEHYRLLKGEIAEVTSRLNILDESNMNTDDNTEPNAPSLQSLREEIYRNTFAAYYKACKDLPYSEGSGAFATGFQSGFKLSKNRTSVLSVRVKQIDLSMSAIEGGEEGMIAFIKTVDEHCAKNEVPFGKFYGCNISLKAGLLVARLRDYTHPLLEATSGKCNGWVVLAQQATYFQPQMLQDVFVGKWWKVRLFRSMSGTTPPMKFYSCLPIHFQKGEVSFGVGYEPVLADVSYAFSVALRRAVLGKRTSPINTPLPKKEKSLPWWDDMRNYIHGINSLHFSVAHWHLLASIDPYEKIEKIDLMSGYMELQQRDGHVSLSAKDLQVHLSSLHTLVKNSRLELPPHRDVPFFKVPNLFFEINMEWQCESRDPMNHFLFSFPVEGKTREKILDPFRSTSLSLQWSFTLTPLFESPDIVTPSNALVNSPTLNVAAHDLSWLLKWWNMIYLPPQKLRMFSRWPRFGVPRIPRSGNLALDRVMTENFIRFTSTPTVINYLPLRDDDPAYGMSFKVNKLKYEMCFSRGKHQQYMFDTKRDTMDLIYQGLNLEFLKANLGKRSDSYQPEKRRDEGFFLSSSYITIRRQAPKADPVRLMSWQEAGRKTPSLEPVKSKKSHSSDSDCAHSDLSDDDGFNILVADNCQRIFVYDLKLLWDIENREAVWSWVAGISKAFQPPKVSPSRLYAQRKLAERNEREKKMESMESDLSSNGDAAEVSDAVVSFPQEHMELLSANTSSKVDVPSSSSPARQGNTVETEEQETKHFIVNFSQPQFNLHSEEANARFLLAAASGKVLARSFRAILHIGYQMIAETLAGTTENNTNSSSSSNNSDTTTSTTTSISTAAAAKEVIPEMTWRRAELSVMLEHVQAHVAPTDVDPGAGLQWLPKIKKGMPELKRTGPLLERVFMPCQMYFRYTRYKGGPELKVKPLKELTFNSPSIAATMTSRQFQVMMDVLTNLLLARSPKPHNNSMVYPSDDDVDDESEEMGEEADEFVPDGVEEVELAKIKVEQGERETKVLIDDIRALLKAADPSEPVGPALQSDEDISWVVTGSKLLLVQRLKKELVNARASRKEACYELRSTMRKAAQLRLAEKEKSKSPSYAMRISMKIEKVAWSMLIDGKSFAETEINDMVYDFDRDFRDKGTSNFTTKSVVVKNCLPNAKSDLLLSAWNPPPEWGKNVMVRVISKQGAPKDGRSPIESFLVDIYPLKIHLTESMYRMMWDYFFPDEEQHSQKRQEVWKVSTIAGTRRVKKVTSIPESSDANQHYMAESSNRGDTSHAKKSQNQKGNPALLGSKPELRRTSSFDQSSWEETVAESVATEIILQAQKPKIAPTKGESLGDLKDSKRAQTSRALREEKKTGKVQEEKRTQPRKMTEFQSFKISQVELLLTYEGSLPINNLRLLMDTFHRENFTGSWGRLLGRVKKHIIVGVVKSVMGIQVKKFKDKSGSNHAPSAVITAELLSSDSDDEQGGYDQMMANWAKRQQSEGAGDGFVSSVKGLFTSQKKKAKQFVLRTMRNDSDHDFHSGKLSDGEAEISPFARQLTIHKARKLIKQHTKKYSRSATNQEGSSDVGSGNEIEDEVDLPSESIGYEGDMDIELSPENKN